jgi:hypothetical protein
MKRPFSRVIPATPVQKTQSPVLYPCATLVKTPGFAFVALVIVCAALSTVPLLV